MFLRSLYLPILIEAFHLVGVTSFLQNELPFALRRRSWQSEGPADLQYPCKAKLYAAPPSRLVSPLSSPSSNSSDATAKADPVDKAIIRQDLSKRIHDLKTQSASATKSRDEYNTEKLTQQSCDELLSLCVAADEWDSVLDVLELMQASNLTQLRSTYEQCLQACWEWENPTAATEILNAQSLAGFAPTVDDVVVVLDTLASRARSVVAKSSNHRYRRPRRYGSGNQPQSSAPRENFLWKDSLAILRRYEATMTLPLKAYEHTMTTFTPSNQWREALKFFNEVVAVSGFGDHPVDRRPRGDRHASLLAIHTSAVECCLNAKQWDQAAQVLQSAIQRGLTPSSATFEAVIVSLSRHSKWRRGLELLKLMDQCRVPRTLEAYNAVLVGMSRAREVGKAQHLLQEMKKRHRKNHLNPRPNEISFNAVISVCVSKGRFRDALMSLDEMNLMPGVHPDIYTYTNAIRACAKTGMTSRALTLFQVAKDKGLKVDAYAYAAAIEACAKDWYKALELLEEMKTQGIRPTEVTYGVAIKACGNGGRWGKAIDLLEQMRQDGLKPNVITYNSVLAALSKAAKKRSRHGGDESINLWQRAMALLDQMESEGLRKDGFTYSAVISCCGAQGEWKQALNLIEQMQGEAPVIQPNKIAYTAAISSCGRAGEVDHALELFERMKTQGLRPDIVAFNALFSALRVAKREEGVLALWGEMNRFKAASRGVFRGHSLSPDIITVTNAIGALASNDNKEYRDQIDSLFSEAVGMGIILANNVLNMKWEVDLSGQTFSVARAATRFILNETKASVLKGKTPCEDLVLITGVGTNKDRKNTSTGALSLRDYIQEVLMEDFNLQSSIPERAQGTVLVHRAAIDKWVNMV